MLKTEEKKQTTDTEREREREEKETRVWWGKRGKGL